MWYMTARDGTNRGGARESYPLSHPKKQAFLDWLLTPKKERHPSTMDGLAEVLQLERRTLTKWKTEDREFMEEWEKRYLKSIGSPERKQSIMDTLYKTATDPDDPKHVAAAKQYMEIEGSLKPVKHQVEVTKNPVNLTDAELDDLLAEMITREHNERNTESA